MIISNVKLILQNCNLKKNILSTKVRSTSDYKYSVLIESNIKLKVNDWHYTCLPFY